jgi:hypothetical protein
VTETSVIEQKDKIEKIEATPLGQLVQILEISFIFILTYVFITLFDTVVLDLNLYDPLIDDYVGIREVGPLNGGQWKAIVQITLVFNLILFGISLLFGLWIRKTRDNWTWSQLGYTLKTPGYKFTDLLRRGILLGLLVIAIFYTILSPLAFIISEGDFTAVLDVHSYINVSEGRNYTPEELNSEYYFGFIEMGLIWPMSAGFFFFAYSYNSLRARFPAGVANILSTTFYVFYLAFFFMIDKPGKISLLSEVIDDPWFWGNIFVFFIILYISFSAFAETKSVVLPFLLNFVLNVGLTIFRAFTALYFDRNDVLKLVPYFFIIIILIAWWVIKKSDFSTIKVGWDHLKDRENMPIRNIIGLSALFFFLAFIIPGIVEQLIVDYSNNPSVTDFDTFIITSTFALMFAIIIILAIIVLTYDPTQVYDVLLITKQGLPLASHIELFQSDEILISGFFSALSMFNKSLEEGESVLKSIKRGEREILIEDGVLTQTIALADKDQPAIRQGMSNLHKEFEIMNNKELTNFIGDTTSIPEAKIFVNKIAKLSITFNIPQQTRWLGALTLVFAPLMIILIGLI